MQRINKPFLRISTIRLTNRLRCRKVFGTLSPQAIRIRTQESGMSEPFLGEIRMVGFNFAPRGWAFCNGQIMSISQNTALFSLLGTMYGGNGQTTFALPDLRSRVPVHAGQGPGLTNRTQGEVSGQENHTLI